MEFLKFMNFLHTLSAIVWIGGMFYTNLVFIPNLSVILPEERGKLMNAVAKRFSIISWVCIILLVATGLHRTPGAMLFETSSRYGILLMVKHIVILLVIIIGLTITFSAVPKMKKNAPKPGEKPSNDFISAQLTLEKLSITNMILGIVIVILISFV